jgi:ankyrin repeat protein
MGDVVMDTGEVDTGDVVQPVDNIGFQNAGDSEDTFRVERMIKAGGIDIDMKDSTGWTPLQTATRYGDIETVDLLLENGASVSAVNTRGETALLVALHMGAAVRYEHIVRSLLLHGSDVNCTGRNGTTALNRATDSSSTAVIKMLLDYGVNLSASDDDGYTALHVISLRSVGSLKTILKICRMLLDYGTCVDDKLCAITRETCGVFNDDSGDDSDDSDGPVQRGWTPIRLAEQLNRPELHAMMQTEKYQLFYLDHVIHKAARARTEAVRKTRQVAVGMGHHQRLGAAGAMALLPFDVMQMIMKQV